MTMRILHTSDWHLGRTLREFPLLEDQRAVLAQIVDHCREGGYDALFISGDLFDRNLPSEEAVKLWSQFLKDFRRACPALPLLVIAGNHDSAARVAYAAEALAVAGFHVRGGAEAIATPVELTAASGERMQVWMFPFLWAGDLDAGDNAGERRIRTQEATLEEAIGRIRPAQDPGALQVALAHCFARGGAASESERILVGTATDVDAALFEGFDYTALGHLHRCQRINARTWYSGSPLPYAFSEATDDKGMLSVTLTAGQAPVITRIPLQAPHPMRRLRGSLKNLLEDPAFSPAVDCLVEITLQQEDAGANPFALLKKRFPLLLHLAYETAGGEAGPGAQGPGASEPPGDLLSDYRRFAASIRLEAETLEQRAALAEQFVKELERKETK